MDDPRRREDNKRAVERFYAVMNARDVDAIAASYAVDASIAVMAPGPFSGEHVPSPALTLAFFSAFPELVFSVGSMTAEEDRVAVEVESQGRLADGSPYRNRYHNLFVFRGEKIALLREYPSGSA